MPVYQNLLKEEKCLLNLYIKQYHDMFQYILTQT